MSDQIFTQEKVNQINELRKWLKEIQTPLWQEAHRLQRETPVGYKSETATLIIGIGMMYEACKVAEASLFNVLNMASTYMTGEEWADKWMNLEDWKERYDESNNATR